MKSSAALYCFQSSPPRKLATGLGKRGEGGVALSILAEEVQIKQVEVHLVQFYLQHLQVMRNSRAIFWKSSSFSYEICGAFYSLFTNVQVDCKWEHNLGNVSSKETVLFLDTPFLMA